VQGERQVDLEVERRQPPERVREAGRRDGYPPGRDAHAFRGVHDPQGLLDVLPVVEGLAHAHEDEVGRFPPQRSLDVNDLAGDLGRAKVPPESAAAAGTERASEFAADLGRKTDRQPPPGRDEDRLDVLAVDEAEEDLCRAVGGLTPVGDIEAADREAGGELIPQRLGERW
jgi:hypothetical protein